MTTIPLDESLDVSRRLVNLRTWQAEWKRIDRELEEQLIPIAGNTLLELQQSVHIANLRRRMEMTLVKQPLSIPESVLKKLGVRAVRSQFAQQFATLSKEERLLWLNSFLFFMTADLRKLDDKIAQVRTYRSLGQTRNFLLGGESGMGKTTYLDWLIFNHLPVVEKERNRVPIIGIQAPVSQDSQLSARTLEGSPGPATLIEQWTGGILRDIMILIRDACRRAILESRPALDPQILEAAWKDIQTKQVTDFLASVRKQSST